MVRTINDQAAVIMSGNGFFSPLCPASLSSDASCANNAPHFDINGTTIIFGNNSVATFDASLPISGHNHPLITDNLYPAVVNLARTIHAAVRIDLGNPSPNNFFLNPSALNATIINTFPATPRLNSSASLLYDANAHPEHHGFQGMLPLTVEGPANIRAVYPCRLQQQKSPGQAFISVLVATLSMSASAWALFMFFASCWTKRGDETGGTITSWTTSTTRIPK